MTESSPSVFGGRHSRRSVLGSLVAGAAWVGFDPAASAHSYQFKGLMIGHLWGPPGADGEFKLFGPILNTNRASDWLVGVRSPAIRATSFERSASGKTTTLDRIELPPGKPVSLAPWSTYIRLVGVEPAAIKDGAVHMTLVFQTAGSVEVKAIIEAQPSD